MEATERGGLGRPIFLLGLPVVALTAAALVPPLFAATVAPAAHFALEGAKAAGGAAIAALAFQRYRLTGGDRRALLIGTGATVLAVTWLAMGILVPLLWGTGPPYGSSSFPFYAWQVAWLVAGAAFAAGALAPRRDPLARLGGMWPTLAVAFAVLAALDLLIALAEGGLPRFDLDRLAASGTLPFDAATTGQIVVAAASAALLVVAAWAVERLPGQDRTSARRLLAVAFLLAAGLQVLELARPAAGRPVIHPGDAWAVGAVVAAFAGLLVQGRSTVELMRRETELAREITRTRAELTSLVAHELRNPLMSIKGLASTGTRLYDTMSDAERLEFFQSIDREATRLREIVNQTSTALRIDAGEVRYAMREESISALVEEAVWESSLREHPVMVEAEPGLLAVCDRGRIMEVLQALLANADKFSPSSAPVEVRAYRDTGGVVVEVSDRGPGIPAEELDRVFEKFSRYRPPGYEQVQGAGLGLFISRAHVQAHGGRLTVDARRPEGTIVRFTLPHETGA
ncbi:MAG: hypothetical protein HY658_09880 [Actinobacteria bacterium]|nr:hypothetical protein [Actinomycetota bacterium]